MNLWKALWADENGFVVTAEAALLGTVGIVGATVGVKMAAQSVNDEMKEAAYAFRNLDQSYSYQGFCSCRAYTAGSCYTQPPVEKSLRELRAMDDKTNNEKRSRKSRDKANEGKRRKPRNDKRRDAKPRDKRDRANEQLEELKI